MSEDLINSIIDEGAIGRQLKFVSKGLDELLTQIKAFGNVRITLEGADNTKKLVQGNNELYQSLGNVKKAQDSFTLAVKEYQKIQDDTARLQAKVAASTSEAAKKAAEYREQVVLSNKANKEIAQNTLGLVDAYGKLKKEYNAAAAAAKNLSAISLKTGSSDDISRATAATAKAKALHDSLLQIETGVGQSQRNVGNYTGALKILETALTEAKRKLDAMTQSERDNTTAGQNLQKEIGLLSTLAGQQDKGFVSLRREVMNATQALATMQEQGLAGTPAFKALQVDVSNAKRGLIEFNNQQKLLSSEVPALAALTSVAKGLGAAYAVGSGATALFGDENAKAAEKLNKLVAVMTLLQGLTELNRTLQERTAIATALTELKEKGLTAILTLKNFILTGSISITKAETTAKEANAVATEGLSAANKAAAASAIALRAALILTGIGALVLLFAAAASAMSTFSRSAAEAKERMVVLNEVNAKAVEGYTEEKVKLQDLVVAITSNNASLASKKEALRELINLSPEYLGTLTLENIKTKEGQILLDKYILSLQQKAELESSQAVQVDATKDVAKLNIIKKQLETRLKEKTAFNDLTKEEKEFFDNSTSAGRISFTSSLLNLTLSKTDIRQAIENVQEEINKGQKKVVAASQVFKEKLASSFANTPTQNNLRTPNFLQGLLKELDDQISVTEIGTEKMKKLVKERSDIQDELDNALNKKSTSPKKEKDHTDQLAASLERIHKAEIEQQKLQLKDEADLNKSIADDEKNNLNERFKALENYSEAKGKLILLDEQEAIRAANINERAGLKFAKTEKDKAAVVAAAEQEKKLAVATAASDTAKLQQDYAVGSEKIIAQQAKKAKEAWEKAYKDIVTASKQQLDSENLKASEKHQATLLGLLKDFADGKFKKEEDYQIKKKELQEKYEQDEINREIKHELELFNLNATLGRSNVAQFKNLHDLRVKELANAAKKEEEIERLLFESKKELIAKEKQLRQDVYSFVSDLIDSEAAKESAKFDKENKDLDENSKRKVDAINASGLAEADKQTRITAIEKQTAFDHEQIEKRKEQFDARSRKIKKIATGLEIAGETASTVFDLVAKAAKTRAEAASLAANPVTASFAPVAFAAAGFIAAQIPFVIASGAINLAKIAAFRKGTDYAPSGPALVSEEGSELVIPRQGNPYLTPAHPTLMSFTGGEKIIPHDFTKDILNSYNLLHVMQRAQIGSKEKTIIENPFGERTVELLKNIERKSGVTVINETPIESTAWYGYHIKGTHDSKGNRI